MDLETAQRLWAFDPLTGHLHWLCGIREGRRADSPQGDGYRTVGHRGRRFKAHRVAWLLHFGCWPQFEIDHLNGVRDDNRIANLRDVPHQVNQLNQKRHRAALAVTEIGMIVTNHRDKEVTKGVTPSRAHAPSGIVTMSRVTATACNVTRDSDIAPLRCDNVTITPGASRTVTPEDRKAAERSRFDNDPRFSAWRART